MHQQQLEENSSIIEQLQQRNDEVCLLYRSLDM